MFKTIVETCSGKVKGERVGDVSVWKGIPYAKPPVGPLRFCPPQEPDTWKGVRETVQFGPFALQPTVWKGIASGSQSEDCLYLNIWSPDADDKLRPVMVWLHGGAYSSGSGSFDMYDGTSFAEHGDVVVVTLNYRLGVFGFLYLAEVGGEKYATSGNCGLLDQIAALKWVKQNIQAFGGDPHRVTLFGESAGAVSVGILLAMPEAKGLFCQAIMESASNLVISADSAAQTAKKVMDSLNLQTHEYEKLIDLPAEELLKVSLNFPPMTFCPVLDGLLIPVPPEEAIRKGAAKDIPVICGSNKDEYRLFAARIPSYRRWDEAEIAGRLERALGKVWPVLAANFATVPMDKMLYNRIMSYYSFVYPTLKYSEALAEQGAVWVYYFGYENPRLGACHAFELPFVWHRVNPDNTNLFGVDSPEAVKLAGQMHQAWIAFAHTGNPNTPELPYWPIYNPESRPVMVFKGESEVVNDPHVDREIWDKVSSQKDYQPMQWSCDYKVDKYS
ncbi:carboxylesterase/lipase family protein [Desulfitobacterium sp.]|uniref:carboxylesterase/lipase family protein n=1 Tax=Desulfitobacterium sp. TaxID=49981 RepID=UPI002B21A061|nr:carboxylesterase/lipase family protein [Desulfitobacterium sp.]MEA4900173.1 carboxylesterase/lipase family protein [Desulfitobacterium sp.]